jgi:hypothetical protein
MRVFLVCKSSVMVAFSIQSDHGNAVARIHIITATISQLLKRIRKVTDQKRHLA